MDGSITTNKGIALIGKLLAQKGALQITRVAVGDGTPPASPATLNALVHELKNATIESVDNRRHRFQHRRDAGLFRQGNRRLCKGH